MPYGPGNPGRPPGQFDFDTVYPRPFLQPGTLYPPGEGIEQYQEEVDDLDLDVEDPGDWWRDLLDIPGNDPGGWGRPQTPGGPGNPIDYDVPHTVGPIPSHPFYGAEEPYQRKPLVPPPGFGPGQAFPPRIPRFPDIPGLRRVPPRFDKPGVIPPDPDNPGASGPPSLVPGQSSAEMRRRQMARYQQMQQMRQRQQMMAAQQMAMQQMSGTPGMNTGVSGPMPQQAY